MNPTPTRTQVPRPTVQNRKATLHATPNGKTAIRIPITNVYANGDFTAVIYVGSNNTPANVILDTGSSTLALNQSTYQPLSDGDLRPTPYAQVITYGTGGWAGPVVKTTLNFGSQTQQIALSNAPVAIADLQEKGNFGHADGILGLAYNALNPAYNLKSCFGQINSSITHPWPFPVGTSKLGVTHLQRLFRALRSSKLTPYFTELEEKGVVANKFAFYTLRSRIRLGSSETSIAAAISDPLNQGWFILGGGEEQTDLFTGSFASVKVVADVYYNTILKSVQVGSNRPFLAGSLEPKFEPLISNCIIDSGTSSLILANDVYTGIIAELKKISSEFGKLIAAVNVNNTDIELKKWPQITFTFEGPDRSEVSLTVNPGTYWQFDSRTQGVASFTIWTLGPKAPSQSILGLPLLNNYYTVFDRSTDLKGVIKFAKIS
jgi:hypothetical protein